MGSPRTRLYIPVKLLSQALIVFLPLLRIPEDGIGGAYAHKALRGVWVIWVTVGMALFAQLVESPISIVLTNVFSKQVAERSGL